MATLYVLSLSLISAYYKIILTYVFPNKLKENIKIYVKLKHFIKSICSNSDLLKMSINGNLIRNISIYTKYKNL